MEIYELFNTSVVLKTNRWKYNFTRFCQSVPETDTHILEELFCTQLPKT